MRRTVRFSSALVLALAATACGKKEEAPPPAAEAPAAPAPAGPSTDWATVDDAAKTVTLEVVAGKDATNNNWNFNGFANGGATVTVPTGYKVTINFSNNDANMAHSIGVAAKATPFSATPAATPAFAGAISPNPTSMTDATKAGAAPAAVTFTADKAGEYALICYVPGHAAAGMWINFTVADGATAGVTAGDATASAAPPAEGAAGASGAAH